MKSFNIMTRLPVFIRSPQKVLGLIPMASRNSPALMDAYRLCPHVSTAYLWIYVWPDDLTAYALKNGAPATILTVKEFNAAVADLDITHDQTSLAAILSIVEIHLFIRDKWLP